MIFLSKLITEMDLLLMPPISNVFIQTTNKKSLDLMLSKLSQYCVQSFTSIHIKLVKIWHPRLFLIFTDLQGMLN